MSSSVVTGDSFFPKDLAFLQSQCQARQGLAFGGNEPGCLMYKNH